MNTWHDDEGWLVYLKRMCREGGIIDTNALELAIAEISRQDVIIKNLENTIANLLK